MKNTTLALFGIAIFSIMASCGKNQPATPDDNRVFVSIPAVAAADTRTVYDETKGRAVWEENDNIRVICYCDSNGQYKKALGASFREFTMSGEYDEDYAVFSGYVDKEPGVTTHYLHAVYPGSAFTKTISGSEEITLPVVQTPSLTSFDGKAAFMYSAPLSIELTSGGTMEVEPFSFGYMVGFLKLGFGTLPSGLGDETVSKVEMRGESGDALAGSFKFGINEEDRGVTYTMSPAAISNTVTLDYSSMDIQWCDLTACWFAIYPGSYDNVSFVVTLASGKVVTYASRSGLVINEGSIKPATLNFKTSDKIQQLVERNLVITGDKLGLTSTTTNKSGKINISPDENPEGQVEISFSGIRKQTASSSNISINAAPSTSYYSNIFNSENSPLGVRILSVTLEATNATVAKNGRVTFGTAADNDSVESWQTGSTITTVFTPRESNANYQYFAVKGNSTIIKTLTVKYQELEEE